MFMRHVCISYEVFSHLSGLRLMTMQHMVCPGVAGQVRVLGVHMYALWAS